MCFGQLRPLLVGGLIVALAVLTGCREQEQDRVLLYKKGTYLGQADTPLSDDQVRELRRRNAMQNYKL